MTSVSPKKLRSRITAARLALKKAHAEQSTPIQTLITDYTQAIDNIILDVWRLSPILEKCALIAVGGYGRTELFPYSDIDILVLTPNESSKKIETACEKFIQALWDLQLEIGHSIRTIEQCVSLARDDVTIMTSILDKRYLAGDKALDETLTERINNHQLWGRKQFFEAKCQEQKQRYQKYGDSGFNLQPDIKHCPGGLRDIQTITWVLQYHFQATDIAAVYQTGFINEEEYTALNACKYFLWQMTLSLQLMSQRTKTRLLFDHQISIAEQQQFTDKDGVLAIEQLMKKYYRTVRRVSQLADMLLQLLSEALSTTTNPEIEVLNDRFTITDNLIEISHTDVFTEHPSALLELFVLLAQHPRVKGIKAATIRAVKKNVFLIDEKFRRDPANTKLFMELLRQPTNVTEQLQRMSLNGLLGQYIPAYAHVTGQMQYDLFHHYTVDQHTIYIVRNLRRFSLPTYHSEFPLCYDIMQTVSKPEIIYIAAIFHDLAKGRGGNHSLLGAQDAKHFCHLHQINENDTDDIVWLIENHLLMSMTAQREDIHEPDTITRFTEKVDNSRRLEYIYLLTVADICATNPTLWNSWRDSLLRDLYLSTKQLLQKQNKTLNNDEIIKSKQHQAKERLLDLGYKATQLSLIHI